MPAKGSAPLSDAVISAIGHLVDDSQTESRQPSHYELGQQFERSGLALADPNKPGSSQVGKRKRVQAVLRWAVDNDEARGERLVALLIAQLRGVGGFRVSSPNYAGEEAILNAREVFRAEGFTLTPDGELLQDLLENLSGKPLTQALRKYVVRARKGADDAALVTGTGKDLVEATAAHILLERQGTYPTTANFPTLLGQAFVNLGLCFDEAAAQSPQDRIDAALYKGACAVNALRNREGTGHGRPFLPSVSTADARIAIGIMALVSERLLDALSASK